MRRNTKHLYTELAFEDGFALVDESIAREQIKQKRLKSTEGCIVVQL